MLMLATLLAWSVPTATWELSVDKGPRQYSPVWLTSKDGNAIDMEIDMGERLILQADPDGSTQRLCGLLPKIQPGGPIKAAPIARSPERAPEFAWTNDTGKSIDLAFDGRPVLRYVYEERDPQDKDGIRKPYHHVFAPDGSRLITKGTGGLYTHHRGIFFGYRRCGVDGKDSDLWHCVKGGAFQKHRGFVATRVGPVFGQHTVEIDWNNAQGRAIAREQRTLRAYRPLNGMMLIDIRTALAATDRPVRLLGDRQHAGVQFRAAQEVADHQAATRYLRPERWSALPAEQEYNGADFINVPWNAMKFRLGNDQFAVAYLRDPANPVPADFSERLYGRFGEYVPFELSREKPLHLHYRLLVIQGREPSRAELESFAYDLSDPIRVTPSN